MPIHGINANSPVRNHISHIADNGVVTSKVDYYNKKYDKSHGKWSLPDDLKTISNTSYADMKKIQADIPGFKKGTVANISQW